MANIGYIQQIKDEIEDALTARRFDILPSLYNKLAAAQAEGQPIFEGMIEKPKGDPAGGDRLSRQGDPDNFNPTMPGNVDPSIVARGDFSDPQDPSSFAGRIGAVPDNVNEDAVNDALVWFYNQTINNVYGGETELGAPRSSLTQAQILVELEARLRRAGLDNAFDMAPVITTFMADSGLTSLEGVNVSVPFGTFVEDQKLRDKTNNTGTQLGWRKQGALTAGNDVKIEEHDRLIRDELERSRGPGGSVAQDPVYQAPDRRIVEENIRNYLAATVGRVDDNRVSGLADIYLEDHRRDWDQRVLIATGKSTEPIMQIDPMASVRARVREMPDYVEIHQHRPEDVDELNWLGTIVSQQRNQGVNVNEALDRGILLSTAGATNTSSVEFLAGKQAQSPSFLGGISNASRIVRSVMR